MYFGQHVEEAIVEYNTSDNPAQKERIFTKRIYPALNKLAENQIYAKKFHEYGYNTYEDKKHECVIHLHSRLEKYNLTKGSAFSYFNRISINWIWAEMKKVKEDRQFKGDLEEVDTRRNVTNELLAESHLEELEDFCYKWSGWGISCLDHLFLTNREKQIGEAVFNLFKNVKSLDIYNKKALYIMVREQVDVKTQYITDVIKIMKPLQKAMYAEYQKNGTCNWNNFLIHFPKEDKIDEIHDEIQEEFQSLIYA
tara:strand:+ start:399 stop:1157 length:759 start_codon:yes stop_codon:yes gene_type:complete